jgi:2-polyprenyl-3-methyl-5-hydroxy-6-metoxy-1,4-benzoquinol methylase
MEKSAWFENWFDTPFYHILYKNRDYVEAEFFISNLLKELALPEKASILDLACGKGRHAYFMAKKGFEVLGLDLSAESIHSAKRHYSPSQPSICMCTTCEIHTKRGNLTMFSTSLPALDILITTIDNQRVVDAIQSYLKPDGTLVVDFMNAHKVANNLVAIEEKEVDGILFKMNREIQDGYVMKHIRFEHKGESYHFTEKVLLLFLEDFEALFKKANFKIEKSFGNYALEAFNPSDSDRLIMLVQHA